MESKLFRMTKTEFINNLIAMVSGLLCFCLGAGIYYINNYISSLIMVLGFIGLYFYIVICTADNNWLDISACFTLVWGVTIGLASLRLTDYQKQWDILTWVCVALAYLMFYVGAFFGKKIVDVKHESIYKKEVNVKGYTLKRQDGRLFWICFVITLIGIICFVINVIIKGFIPFFSSSTTAYTDFYTKFYVFITAASMISGLSYYTLITQKNHWWKKAFLIFSIVYSTFFIPTIVVSRGMFLTSALSLLAVVFYMHKRRFIILCLGVMIIFAFYALGTVGRGYTSAQLDEIFEPTKIETVKPNDTIESGSNNGVSGSGGENAEPSGFQLSGKLAFVYSYLTVSHDNFNEAIINKTDYTYGIRQIIPFNTILRIGWIETRVDNAQTYLVRPHLNTINLVGYAYYDFGIAGVAVLTFLWATLFGIIQAWAIKGNKPFGLLTLGNTLSPVILCFFTPWMSIFSHWMHWGLILIMFLVACITKKDKSDMSDKNIEYTTNSAGCESADVDGTKEEKV